MNIYISNYSDNIDVVTRNKYFWIKKNIYFEYKNLSNNK